MGLRDWINVVAGASVAFATGLIAVATSPTPILWTGLALSLALLAGLSVAQFFGQAWLSAHIKVLSASGRHFLVEVGIRNHGTAPYGEALLNVLFPDDVIVTESDREGHPKPSAEQKFAATPESLDNEGPSVYWFSTSTLSPGSFLYYFPIDTKRSVLPLGVRVGNAKKDVTIPLSEGESRAVAFTSLRSTQLKFLPS